MDVLREMPRLTFFRGRVGLYAILKALDIGPGDEVATQAFTCLAVPEGIMATGAKPVYVDTEAGGVNMCPQDLLRILGPHCKAVVVQHTFGVPAQMGPIREILEERGLPLIEDCCHTYASTYVNQVVGTFGVGAFYSFEWGKPIIAGIGGSAVVNDPALRAKVEEFYRSCQEPGWKTTLKIQIQFQAFMRLYRPEKYWQVRRTFQRLSKSGAAQGNYNPTGEVAADFGLRMAPPLRARLKRKLQDAHAVAQHSRDIAAQYESGVSAVFKRVFVPEGAVPVYARFPLLTDSKPALLEAAEEASVEIADWYKTPIHPLSAEESSSVHYEPGSCPNAESLSHRLVSLPINQKVDARTVQSIVEFLNGF